MHVKFVTSNVIGKNGIREMGWHHNITQAWGGDQPRYETTLHAYVYVYMVVAK